MRKQSSIHFGTLGRSRQPTMFLLRFLCMMATVWLAGTHDDAVFNTEGAGTGDASGSHDPLHGGLESRDMDVCGASSM